MIFHWKILTFFIFQKKIRKFSENFFEIEKNILFSELQNFLGYSFDAEKSELSIGDVFRAIQTLLHTFWELFLKFSLFFNKVVKKTVSVFQILLQNESNFRSQLTGRVAWWNRSHVLHVCSSSPCERIANSHVPREGPLTEDLYNIINIVWEDLIVPQK